MSTFVIVDYRHGERTLYLSAPPGWSWRTTGAVRDRLGFRAPAAEWSPRPQDLFPFKSRRAAARIRNKCFDTARIEERA